MSYIEKDKVLDILSKIKVKKEEPYISSLIYIVLLLMFMLLLFVCFLPFFLVEYLIRCTLKGIIKNENNK